MSLKNEVEALRAENSLLRFQLESLKLQLEAVHEQVELQREIKENYKRTANFWREKHAGLIAQNCRFLNDLQIAAGRETMDAGARRRNKGA